MVQVEAPLAPWRHLLEQRIPQQLADGRVGLGPLGSVSYEVTRGDLSIDVEDSVLVIETPARVRVDQCRGSNCRVACDAVARAEVPLTTGLRETWEWIRKE